jgi:chorismate synthase
MASNWFGERFRITTWGESHGPAIGVVIDGCPAGLEVSEEEIACALRRRRPGYSQFTSPRKEEDIPKLLSGVYQGRTTGGPISILIENRDVDSSKYLEMSHLFRPGHADFTYLQKYGVLLPGGGRASARETAARVAAGAIASKWLMRQGVSVTGFLREAGGVEIEKIDFEQLSASKLFCPDPVAEERMIAQLEEVRAAGDSIGGIVEAVATGVPVGWGDPVYGKIEARLAAAMLSLPASKGFEIGDGFAAARMRGSDHNDTFVSGEQVAESNHAGGLLGGISTGLPIVVRTAFKPTSSIACCQRTVNREGQAATLTIPPGSRHDPCVAIRAVPVVEAMMALVLADVGLNAIDHRQLR